MLSNFIFNQTRKLERIQQSMPGGFYQMFFVKVQDVLTLGPINPVTGTIAELSFRPGIDGHSGFYAPRRKGYKEVTKKSDAGNFLEITVTCFVPYEDLPTHLAINSMMVHDYILALSTHSGLVRILGSLDNPVKFSHEFTTGDEPKDVPGTTLMFTWQTEYKPPIFVPANGSEPTPIGGGIDVGPMPSGPIIVAP